MQTKMNIAPQTGRENAEHSEKQTKIGEILLKKL